jgi:hypothetical protein
MAGKLTNKHHAWVKDTSGGQHDPTQHEASPTPAADGPQAASDGPPASGGSTWNAPFDLGPADSTYVARTILVQIQADLKDYSDIGYGNEMAIVDSAITKQVNALPGDRALTATEVTTLTGLGLMAWQARQDALKNFVDMITAELDKYNGVDAQAAEDAAAELLHQQFRTGKGDDKIADLKAAMVKTGEMAGQVKEYVDYAKNAKVVFKSAAKLEDVSKGIEAFKGKLGKAENTLQIASEVATLAQKVGQAPSGTSNDINSIRAGLAIGDLVMSKTSVPLIGFWWTNYLKPCTEKALAQLQKLNDMVDKATRSNLAEEWWDHASKGMQAPIITDPDSGLNDALLASVFPGGQPMLNFMWSFFRGNPPSSAPASVGAQFVKYRKQFNAGLPESEQLQTDADWTNAWKLFGTEEAKGLTDWVAKNKAYIWAAEYGALPHP